MDSEATLPAPAAAPERALTSADTEEARSIRRAIRLGLLIWPCFLALDVFMCSVVYPGTSIARFVVLRLVGEAGIGLAWWLARSPLRRVRQGANALMCVLTGVLVSIMALSFGGLVSAYVHGLSVIVLVESAAIAARFSASLAVTLPTVLSYPLVMGLAAPLNRSVRAALANPKELAIFSSHYVFVLASALIASLVSHAVWRTKRELREARRLQRYRLETRIGKGDMNEVWLARDTALGRQVALKILRSTEPDEVTLSRFEREAQATSQLTSPHTVRIHDYGASDDGVYFIAMEYLPGMDLSELVARHGPLPAARVVHFALQACRSLQEAHEHGIVHRDIKPANLFVTRIDDDEDGLKVLDFGIARLRAADTQATLSEPGSTVGTPAYMAPELLTGASADERSDLYSLGATLYALLTGAPPFPGATMHAVFMAHVAQIPVSPSERLGAPVPPRLEAAVLRCLEKDPARRPGAARELAAALETSLDATL